jgi:rubrerythrin
MTIEEAIRTAIEYEKKVRDVYVDSRKSATNEVGRRVFGILAKEEQQHVDYLQQKLRDLESSGHVTSDDLDTILPAPEAIAAAAATLESKLAADDQGRELGMLRQAFQVEVETSEFYQRMAKELDREGREFFARFLVIEEGHVALVRSEIDVLSGTGFWFDMQEFGLENA